MTRIPHPERLGIHIASVEPTREIDDGEPGRISWWWFLAVLVVAVVGYLMARA